MEGEFWDTLWAEAWEVMAQLGSMVAAWASSEPGRSTLLGIGAGLLGGWAVARLYFRGARLELSPLVKRLEAGTAHLESSLDRLQSEIVVANRQLETLLERQADARRTRRSSSAGGIPEPLKDLGTDWSQVGGAAETEDAADDPPWRQR
jgi:exonuclease VII small subunit